MPIDCYLVKVSNATLRKGDLMDKEWELYYNLPPLTDENLVRTNKDKRAVFGRIEDDGWIKNIRRSVSSAKDGDTIKIADPQHIMRFNQGGLAHFLYDLETGKYYILGVFKTKGKDWTWGIGKVSIATGVSKNLEEIITPEKIFSEGEEIFFTKEEEKEDKLTLLTPILRGDYDNLGIIQETLKKRYTESALNALNDLNINLHGSEIREDTTITYNILEDMLDSNITVKYSGSNKNIQPINKFEALTEYQIELGAIDHILPVMVMLRRSDILSKKIKIRDSEIDSEGKPLHRPIILLPIDRMKTEGRHILKADGYAIKAGRGSYGIEEATFEKFSPLTEEAVYAFKMQKNI